MYGVWVRLDGDEVTCDNCKEKADKPVDVIVDDRVEKWCGFCMSNTAACPICHVRVSKLGSYEITKKGTVFVDVKCLTSFAELVTK